MKHLQLRPDPELTGKRSGSATPIKRMIKCCGAGAATFRVELEPIFLLAGAGAAFLKAAPDASFWQAKKESLVVVTKYDSKATCNGKCDPKKTCITN